MMISEDNSGSMAHTVRCAVAAAVVALADLAEVRALQDVQSHVSVVMADEVLWGCIENLRGLNARLLAEFENGVNSHVCD